MQTCFKESRSYLTNQIKPKIIYDMFLNSYAQRDQIRITPEQIRAVCDKVTLNMFAPIVTENLTMITSDVRLLKLD
jgi:hypothetical protein